MGRKGRFIQIHMQVGNHADILGGQKRNPPVPYECLPK